MIDRTPFVEGSEDLIGVQRVTPHIYDASYPLRLLGYERLLGELGRDWTLLTRYVTAEGRMKTSTGVPFEYRGVVLRRKEGQ